MIWRNLAVTIRRSAHRVGNRRVTDARWAVLTGDMLYCGHVSGPRHRDPGDETQCILILSNRIPGDGGRMNRTALIATQRSDQGLRPIRRAAEAEPGDPAGRDPGTARTQRLGEDDDHPASARIASPHLRPRDDLRPGLLATESPGSPPGLVPAGRAAHVRVDVRPRGPEIPFRPEGRGWSGTGGGRGRTGDEARSQEESPGLFDGHEAEAGPGPGILRPGGHPDPRRAHLRPRSLGPGGRASAGQGGASPGADRDLLGPCFAGGRGCLGSGGDPPAGAAHARREHARPGAACGCS